MVHRIKIILQALLRTLAPIFRIAFIPLVFVVLFVFEGVMFDASLHLVPYQYVLQGVLATCALGFVLYGPAIFFSRRGRPWYLLLVSLITSVIMGIEYLYYSYSGGFLQASALHYAAQTGELGGTIATLFHPALLFFLMTPLASLYFFVHDTSRRVNSKKELIIASFVLVGFVVLGYGSVVGIEKTEWGNVRRLYSQMYDIDMVVKKIGVINYFFEDAIRLGLRTNNVKPEDKAFVEKWNNSRSTKQSTKKNFGIAKGRNIIFIQVESLENAVINAEIGGQEITPHLNAFAREGMYFSNYFTQVGEGNTADAEFVVLNSLYPLPESVAFVDYAQNQYNALPEVLKDHGYATAVLHGDVPAFWNRANMYPKLSYQTWFMRKDFSIPRSVGFRDLGDEDFFTQSVPKLKNLHQPFMATLITLSSHTPFILPKDLQTLTIPEGSAFNDNQKNYLESIHYTDSAIGNFIMQLKAAHLYDNSVIIIFGDHGSYTDIATVLGAEENTPKDLRTGQVPLIIFASKTALHGTQIAPASHIDLYPTVVHLLGIEPPKSVLGHDVFNNSSPVVVYRKAGSGVIGSVLDSSHAFVAASDDVYEHGICTDVKNNTPVSTQECRQMVDSQEAVIRVSDTVVRGNLISLLNASQIKTNGAQ